LSYGRSVLPSDVRLIGKPIAARLASTALDQCSIGSTSPLLGWTNMRIVLRSIQPVM
jgi:hypothetical protein